MATKIEYTEIQAKNYVEASSRYANSRVLKYGEQGVLTFETYKRKDKITSDQDKFAIIPPGEEYRPDLTSYRAYGTVDYWWLIMETNNIKDIFDYKSGLNIRIPSAFNLL